MASPAAKHAHHLSVEIGPRPPTSSSEAQAAQYCASVFEEAGLQTRLEPFHGLRSFGQIYIPTTAALFGAAMIGARKKRHPLLATILAAPALAAFWGEQTSRWRPLTDRLAGGPSQNVVAVLPSGEQVRRRLVVVAHVDSSRSGLMFHPKLVKDFRRNALAGVAAGISAVLAWLLPSLFRRLVAAASAAVLANGLALLVEREIAGRDVQGANDNASGAGVMLALAEALAAEPLAHTEVWFLASGCEESDLVGMSAFVERHQRELEDAWFLGLDTVAGPETSIRWIVSSSLLETLKPDQHLVRIAEEVAAGRPEFDARPGSWQSAGLDTDVATVRGLRAMSLVALTEEGRLPNWHWPTDIYENLDEGALDRCFGFALELIRRFDRYA